MIEWVKALPGRKWDPERTRWVVTGIGKNPTKALLDAGFELDIRTKVRDEELALIDSLEELVTPCAIRWGEGTEALIYPRLLGFDEASKLIPSAAAWDRELGGWRTTCVDLVRNGHPLPGVIIDDEVIEVAAKEATRITTAEHLSTQAASVAQSLGTNTDPEHLADLIAEVGDIPDWFGGGVITPFPYQRAGAIACAAGHTLVADAPGVGKTITSLAAAAIAGAKRVVVLCPAKVITSWLWHANVTGVATLGGTEDGTAMSIVAGRKVKPFPDRGVIVLTDALLGGRRELLEQLMDWSPDVLIYDEAHRSKTWGSRRAAAARELASAVTGLRICATGTPMNASPEEMCSQLEVTGHLGPVFGGRTEFLETFCKQNHFKAWVARKAALPLLRKELNEHVWVRRNKKDVLKDLPPKSRFPMMVDVPLTEFKKAHSDVLDKIDEWLDTLDGELDPHSVPDMELVEEWARSQIGLMSPLRVAAGLSKVPAAAEYVADWVHAEVAYDDHGVAEVNRPLVVWVHHKEVAEAMIEAALEAVSDKSLVRAIVGGTSERVADAAVADFQAGKVAVLVLSITAAGVGITLTRGSDVLFVETTYVNAEVSQAEDRCVLEGQMVQTKHGPVPIEDVQVGDLVLTHLGRWRPVTDKWSRGVNPSCKSSDDTRTQHKELISEIEYIGSKDVLAVTHDHEVWVKREDGKIEWAQAHTLLPRDQVATPRAMEDLYSEYRDTNVVTPTDEIWAWWPVREVSTRIARNDERVWDLTVEDDESYVVGLAAVHNCNRIGSTNTLIVQTMIAPGTLDERIQSVLGNKADVLDVVLVGGDNRTAVLDASKHDLATPAQIVSTLVWEAVERRKKTRKGRKHIRTRPDIGAQRAVKERLANRTANGRMAA